MQEFTAQEAIDQLDTSEREIFTPESREALVGSSERGINVQNLIDRLENHRVFLTQTERFFARHVAEE